jgi:hypothetical protein
MLDGKNMLMAIVIIPEFSRTDWSKIILPLLHSISDTKGAQFGEIER